MGKGRITRDKGIFMLRVRKCLRCGRLLTSKEAVDLGYGPRCAELAGARRREKGDGPEKEGQMDFFGLIFGNGGADG